MFLNFSISFCTIFLFICSGFSNVLAEALSFLQVKPIFQDRCVMCHSGPNAPLSLRLDSLENLMQGSKNGPVVIVGKPENSEIILRLKGIKQPRMPMSGPPYLTDKEISLIEQWILEGMSASENSTEMPVERPIDSKQNLAENSFSRVKDLFGTRCVKCHAEKGLMGPSPEGYLLTSYESILSTKDRVRVVPNYPATSELVRRIKGHSLPRMPFDGPPYLASEEIEYISTWISDGARNADNVPAAYPLGARVRLNGHLKAGWSLEDGLILRVNSSTRIDKSPRPGDYVEVRGTLGENGIIRADRIRRR